MILYLDCETLPAGTLAHVAAGLDLGDAPAGWECPPRPAWEPPALKSTATTAAGLAKAHERHREAVAESFAAYHAPGAEAAWRRDAIAAEWERRRPWSLDPLEAEIACMAYAIDDGTVEVTGDPLGVLDRVFMARVDIIVAHNAAFDAGMLWVAAMRAGNTKMAGWLALHPYQVTAAHKLYAGPRWVDTMDLLPFRRPGSYRTGASQQAAAALLGVSRPHPLRGSEVFDAVMTGRIDEVREHCRSDVEELRDIHRALWASAKERA